MPNCFMSVSMRLCDRGTSSRTVRHMVREMLITERVQAQDVADVETILGELCTNVERHGRSTGGKYLLELEIYTDKIIIKVEDQGKGFDFSSLPDPNFDPLDNMALAGTERDDCFGDVRLGGWGIPTIQSLANHVTYAKTLPTGTTVYVEKYITYLDDANNKRDTTTPSPDPYDYGVIDAAIKLTPTFGAMHMTTVQPFYEMEAI